jgi:hypothetical protein
MRVLSSLIISLCLAVPPVLAGTIGEAGRYMTTAEFLESSFPEGAPGPSTLWVKGDLRQSIETILGHPFGALRLRYWHAGEKSAWVLEEVGKELPITIGVSVAAGEIRDVRILEFRESRGWEVRYPFFTEQFLNARLRADGRLDRDIDSISGATLSVGAVTRIARIALVLHDTINQKG